MYARSPPMTRPPMTRPPCATIFIQAPLFFFQSPTIFFSALCLDAESAEKKIGRLKKNKGRPYFFQRFYFFSALCLEAESAEKK